MAIGLDLMDTPETLTQMSEQVRRKLKVAMQENARLKAEVERLTNRFELFISQVNDDHQLKLLKAEVERLTAFTTRTIIPNEELQAQVERLTKAGDAMASSIQFNEEMAQDYNGPTIVHQSVQRWQAAKEGETK